MKKVMVLMLMILLSVACAKKETVAPDSSGAGSGRKGMGGEDVTVVDKDRIGSKELTDDELRRRAESLFQDVHFGYNKYDIREEDKPILREIADFMLGNTSVHIMVEGNCDQRGTNEYNLALGDQRAKAARNQLISLGVPGDRVETISFGKERPLCQENSEACHAKNRRDHFILNK